MWYFFPQRKPREKGVHLEHQVKLSKDSERQKEGKFQRLQISKRGFLELYFEASVLQLNTDFWTFRVLSSNFL